MENKILIIEQDLLNALIGKVDLLYQAYCQNQTSKEEWLQPQDALKLLGVSSRCMQGYRDNGLIGFAQLTKKKILYRRADIEKMLEGKYVQPFKTGGKIK